MPEDSRILLHVCCGPCATSSIERLLEDGRKVELFYSNSNIYPYDEYVRRREGVAAVADYFRLGWTEDDYDHDSWLSAVSGLEAEPERGRRCSACFRFSLGRTAAKSVAEGYAGYTTTLSVSPHKDSAALFAAGNENAGFMEYNFKKRNGYGRSIELSKMIGLYRQDYCGCEFSKKM